ncbi:MAG TPA: hypothetical protein DEB40_07370 [Elusimicrobia bacterium]|nr:hypothetical protein [Elusimicrobiota bacterium]HBT61547.1 hypothetical protein [Elusimicrobiota bacterium]
MRALTEGFWLGLSTGPYCFMSCAPLLLPLLCSEARPGLAANLAALGRFLAGRFLAYLAVGCVAGALGGAFGPVLPGWFFGLVLGLTALLMLAYAAIKSLPRFSLCQAAGRWMTPARMPFTLGLLTGINVCPPFVIGLMRALILGSAWAGGVFFGAFFVATSLYLLPVLGIWPWLSSSWARIAGRAALVLAGLWYLFQAANLMLG